MSSACLVTGDNMKSQLLYPERLKIEVRKSIHRRKMNKSSPIVNGDHLANVTKLDANNLVTLSIDHHIGPCTKSSDISKSMDNQLDRMTLPCETDHIYANSCDFKSSKEDNEQVKHLKEMLLVHLDLIQQQQEQLLGKERQLQTIKLEKEALKCRLERMERRLSLLRQKKESNRIEEQFVFKTEKPEPLIPIEDTKSNQLLTEHTFYKKKTSINSQVCSQKTTEEKTVQVGGGLSHSVRRKMRSPETETHQKNSYLGPEQTYMCHVPALTSRPDSPLPNQVVEDMFAGVAHVIDGSVLLTVPSWRYHPVSSCYQLEGTEVSNFMNLDDEVYLKRHQKLELDEKRRKRWDIQRIREQRLQEKLKHRAMKNARSYQDTERTSFFPNPDKGMIYQATRKKAEVIEITDTVPVIAFGHTIPVLQHCEFQIPWLDPESTTPTVTVKPEKDKHKTTYTKRSKTK